MTVKVTKVDHLFSYNPWKYQVKFPNVEEHEIDMENLQPTLDLVKKLEEIRKAVVALFPGEPVDDCLTEAFTDIIDCIEGELEEPGIFNDEDHLTGEVDHALNHLYDYCDHYRVLLNR